MNTLALAAVAISGSSIVQALIWLIVGGLIYFLCRWALTEIAPPEPFAKICHVILILVVLVLCINALLMVAGTPFLQFH